MSEEVSCGVRFLRGLLLITNILFILIGLGLIGVGIYMKVSSDFTSILDQFEIDGFNGESLSFLAFVLIGGGAFTLLLALFGCAGTLWNNRCLLYFYAFILFILMIIELVGFILAFVYRGRLEDTYKKGLDTVLKKGLINRNDTRIVDIFKTLQTNLKCCGANNASDYINANRSDLAVWCYENHVASKGCSQEIIDILDGNLPAVGGTLGGVLAVEFFGLLFAIILAVALRHVSKGDYSSNPGEVIRAVVPGRRFNYRT